MANYGKLIIKIDGDTRGLRDALSGIDKIGAKSIKALGAAIAATTATMTLAVKEASAYETSLAKISTIADTTKTSMADIDRGILDLSNSTGMAAADLSEALYEAISSSVDTEKAVDFVSDALKLARGGFTDTATSVDVLTTTLNAYGMEATEAQRVSDVLIMTQNKGKTTVNELGASIGKVIPTAAAYGVSIENLGASYSILTARGIGTAEATTYLNGMLNELGKSGTKVSDILKKKTGKSFKELVAEGNSLGDILEILQKEADKSGLQMNDLFSSIEAGKSALTLVNAGTEEYNATLKDMENSAGATEDAFEKMGNTTEITMAKLKTRVQNTFIDIGKSALPAVNNLANTILKTFDNPKVEQAIENLKSGLADFGNSVSNVVRTALPPLISGLSWLISNLGTVTKSVLSFVAAFTAVKAVINVSGILQSIIPLFDQLSAVIAANPYTVLASAIAGIISALVVWSETSKQVTKEELIRQEAVEESIEATNELTNAVEQQREAYQASSDAINDNAQVRIAELDRAKELADELFNLADANGKVAEGDKARAEVILGELNNALDTNYTLTGSIIDNYSKLESEIYKTIEAEKSLAVVNAYSELYNEAIKNEITAKRNLNKATEAYVQAKEAEAAIVAEVQSKIEKSTGVYLTYEEAVQAATDGEYSHKLAQGQVRISLEEQQSALQETSKGIEGYTEAVEAHSQAVIESENIAIEKETAAANHRQELYEETTKSLKLHSEQQKFLTTSSGIAIAAEIQKNNDKILYLEDLKNKARSEAEKEALQESINNAELYGSELEKKYRETNNSLLIDEQQTNLALIQSDSSTWQGMVNTAVTQSKNLVSQHQNANGRTVSNTENSKQKLTGIFQTTWSNIQSSTATGGNKTVSLFGQAGTNSIKALQNSLSSGSAGVSSRMSIIAASSAAAYAANTAATSLGRNTVAGIAKGISDDAWRAVSAAQNVANRVRSAYNSILEIFSPSRVMRKSGRYTTQGVALGIEDEIPNAEKAAINLANAIQSPMDKEISMAFADLPKGFLDSYFDKVSGVPARVQAVMNSMTPNAALNGGYGSTRIINNTTTTTNAPTMVFQKEVQSPDVVAREVNKVFTFGLAGDR